MAIASAVTLKECGATRIVECWGDDPPEGKFTRFTSSTSFNFAVKAGRLRRRHATDANGSTY